MGEIGVKSSSTGSGSLTKRIGETLSGFMDGTQEIWSNCPQPRGGLGSQEHLYVWQMNPTLLVLRPIINYGDLVSGAWGGIYFPLL